MAGYLRLHLFIEPCQFQREISDEFLDGGALAIDGRRQGNVHIAVVSAACDSGRDDYGR